MTGTSEDSDPMRPYYLWALCDLWPLEDAAALVVGETPRELGSEGPREPTSKLGRAVREMALNCAGHTLQLEPSEARDGQYMVEPRMFVAWFTQRVWEIPDALREALSDVRDAIEESNKTRRSKLRPEQRHCERTRGVAAYLWSQDPTIRIGSMADRRDVWAITCENRSYSREKIHAQPDTPPSIKSRRTPLLTITLGQVCARPNTRRGAQA